MVDGLAAHVAGNANQGCGDQGIELRGLAQPEGDEAAADADYDAMERIEERVLGINVSEDEPQLDAKAAGVVLSNMRWRMEKRKGRTYGQKVEVKAQLTLEQLVAESLGGSGTGGGGN